MSNIALNTWWGRSLKEAKSGHEHNKISLDKVSKILENEIRNLFISDLWAREMIQLCCKCDLPVRRETQVQILPFQQPVHEREHLDYKLILPKIIPSLVNHNISPFIWHLACRCLSIYWTFSTIVWWFRRHCYRTRLYASIFAYNRPHLHCVHN